MSQNSQNKQLKQLNSVNEDLLDFAIALKDKIKQAVAVTSEKESQKESGNTLGK